MVDDNRARTDILFKALADVGIIYNKIDYPNLEKNDYETLKNIFGNIKTSVELSIEINYPNVNIENIPPKLIFAMFLNEEHGMDLSKQELETILNNIN